ncbi:MAG: ABC transporter permease subunit [Acidimicrobiales bacterium]
MSRITVNPVLSRELRQRVRSRRASVVLTVYLSLLVGAVGLLVWGFEQAARNGGGMTQGLGQTLFGTLLFAILGLVCFIVPGVAAGAVAGERERLTLMPLQVTLLTPGQILRGKLLASLAFTTLLLVATLPLLAVAYVLGGVTVSQIAGGLFFVLATAAFLGVISIWASTVLRRVQAATVVAYGMVGVLVIGTMIAYGVQVLATARANEDRGQGWESLLFVAPNPFVVTADALGHDVDVAGASPFTPSQSLLQRRDERRRGAGISGDDVQREVRAGRALQVETTIDQTVTPPVPAQAPPTTIFDPQSSGKSGGSSSGRMVMEDDAGFDAGRDGGDFTDRGPIWAWTFGWWALLGAMAYLHAGRRLRLPSITGVRP